MKIIHINLKSNVNLCNQWSQSDGFKTCLHIYQFSHKYEYNFSLLRVQT